MKIFEITEASVTTKPVEKNGKSYYKHDYSDQLFASEQMARDDERKKKPFISQKLKTFGGKASDVQDFKEVTPEELKKRLAEIFGILIFAAGILLLIALITYSPEDPNFIFPQNKEIKNFGL